MSNRIPAFSEEAIALDMAQRVGSDWLYAADMALWLRFRDGIWRVDDRGEISATAREFCREFSALAAKDPKAERQARALASAHTRAAIVSLLSNDQRLVVTNADLDSDPMLLGTPGGHVDLRTGELLPAERKHRITMSTAVAPAAPGTPCPIWQNFLETTFPLNPGQPEPDSELIEFKQRLSGYALTGETSEERFAFLHGAGRNGKGVFVETITSLMNDYATVLPAEALMERTVDPHRAELAVLRGKRLVLANEISLGRRWNQSRLMDLTGGGSITANRMRGDPFTFKFQGKLWIVGNHKPVFPAANDAVAERILLSRFRMKFLHPNEHSDVKDDPTIGVRNNNLKVQLQAEWPAILRWCINGCIEWQQTGLKPPARVLEDSADYIADSDELVQWLADCCSVNLASTGGGAMTELFASWNLWRADRQEASTTLPQFRERVKERFAVTRANFGMKVGGVFLTDFARARLLQAKEERRRSKDHRDMAAAGAAQ